MESSELEDCPVAKKFWYDKKNSEMTKYLIRFHNDDGDWTQRPLIEQVGLNEPKFNLKFEKLERKLIRGVNHFIWSLLPIHDSCR